MFGQNRGILKQFKLKPQKLFPLTSSVQLPYIPFHFLSLFVSTATTSIHFANSSYKTGQTLRFPRVEKIRDDKTWKECLDINELERIRTIAKGKLTYQHATTSDEPVTKKKKRIVTRIESPLKVAKHFAAANTSNVEEVVG